MLDNDLLSDVRSILLDEEILEVEDDEWVGGLGS